MSVSNCWANHSVTVPHFLKKEAAAVAFIFAKRPWRVQGLTAHTSVVSSSALLSLGKPSTPVAGPSVCQCAQWPPLSRPHHWPHIGKDLQAPHPVYAGSNLAAFMLLITWQTLLQVSAHHVGVEKALAVGGDGKNSSLSLDTCVLLGYISQHNPQDSVGLSPWCPSQVVWTPFPLHALTYWLLSPTFDLWMLNGVAHGQKAGDRGLLKYSQIPQARLPAAPANHSYSPAPSDAQQGLHSDLPLPPVLDQVLVFLSQKFSSVSLFQKIDLQQILHDLPKGPSPLFLIGLELCPSSSHLYPSRGCPDHQDLSCRNST
ncbi:hypothetical protein EK904_005188 [Melospiza melodia maxima]|nr:hypothetical protein EK904_005188 [Melospiza melodia maxima]